jgi:hypothetical protein
MSSSVGLSAIRQKWLHALARHDEVASLFNRFVDIVSSAS